MKRILLFLVVMTAFATVAGAQGWFRQPTPNDTLHSTVVLPDNSVAFQIYAPEAESVAVMGDFPWDKPARFVKEENGVWKGRISTMTEGVLRNEVYRPCLHHPWYRRPGCAIYIR